MENIVKRINKNAVIKITIKKEDASKEDVIQIMECVDDLTNQKYSPELKFIDE